MIPATAFTILFALWCARDDAQQIAQHSKIHHGLQWSFRAAVVVAVCYWWASWWLAFAMAGLFSAVFRWDLNGRRGLDWRYIAPWSNIYDKVWFLIETRNINFQEDVPLLIRYGPLIYNSKEYVFVQKFEHRRNLAVVVHEYQRWVRRAGTMAYIFEALLFVGVIYLHWRSKA